MQLTSAQNTTLKNAINADQNISDQPNNGDGNIFIADYLNAAVSPDFVIWKSLVTQDEVMLNGFDWARVDNLSVGKARIWEWMFDNANNAINPSKANIRAGIDATWVGTAADLAVRAAVYTHCKRPATRIEKLFATGTGSTADPATLGTGADGQPIEGAMTADQVQEARNS